MPRCANRGSVSSQDSVASSSRGSWKSPTHSPSHTQPLSLPHTASGNMHTSHQPQSLPPPIATNEKSDFNINNNRQQKVSPMKTR